MIPRLARPRAVLAVWCYGLTRIDPEVDAVVAELYETYLGPFWEPERRLVEGLYRDFQDKASLISELDVDGAKQMISSGAADKGMIPKLEACITAIKCARSTPPGRATARSWRSTAARSPTR